MTAKNRFLMKSILAGLLQLLLYSCSGGLFAQDVSNVVPCHVHVTPNASTQVGLFTVHQRCGHVLYEIPPVMLGRVMLISTEFAALKSREGDTQTAGRFADTHMVRWVRRGDQVQLQLVQFDLRADAARGPPFERGRMYRGVLIRSFDVLSEGAGGAPVIDVTSLVFFDIPAGSTQEFRRRFRMMQPNAQRSYIDRIKVFPQNIEVRFTQTWTANPEEFAKQSESSDNALPPSMEFMFHATLLLL